MTLNRATATNLASALALAVVAFASPLRAQGFGAEIRVNDDAAGSMQGSPSIQVGGDGRVYVAWVNAVDGRGTISLAWSDDRASTFAPARIVVPGHTALAGMQRGVQFVVDRRGGIHMTWQERIVPGSVSAMYARSLDGGVTFSTPIFAGADSGRFNQDFPSIAIDSNDNVVMAWIDDREIELGTSANTQLYFTRSTDRGESFGAPVRASLMPGGIGGSCECCNTAIATTPDGVVFIAFRGNVNNYRDIHVARTSDGGQTFEVFRAASQSWQIGACPMTGSSIAVDRDDRAHVVWRDSRQAASGREVVYYATLARDGAGCSMDLPVSDSPKRTNFPSIGVTAAGAIVVAYQDTRADASDIQTTVSLNGGNSFAPSMPMLGRSLTTRQELVWLAVAPDGTRYAVWQDLRRDGGDIVLARDTSTLVTNAPGSVTPSFPLEGAVVSSVPSLMWYAPENLGDGRQADYAVTITDGGDDTTRFAAQVDRSQPVNIGPGRYQWWVRTRTSVGESMSGPFAFTVQSTSGVASDNRLLDMTLTPGSATEESLLHIVLDRPETVEIAVFDLTGSLVASVTARALGIGDHDIVIGGELAPGGYLVRVDAGRVSRTLPLFVR